MPFGPDDAASSGARALVRSGPRGCDARDRLTVLLAPALSPLFASAALSASLRLRGAEPSLRLCGEVIQQPTLADAGLTAHDDER